MSLYLGENLISGQATLVGESRNIGQIIPSIIPLTDAGLHLLDGSLISGSGSYSDFVDYIGDLYDNTTGTLQSNVNIVGSLTNTNGVLSGFSTSNYATLPITFNPGSSTWEIVVKFTTSNSFGSSQAIFSRVVDNYYGVVLIVTAAGKIYTAVASSSSTLIGEFDSSSTLNISTTYYAKLEFTGSAYKLYLSTDGETYNLEGTITSSTQIVGATTNTVIGLQGSIDRHFQGSIDLKESYINVNGSRWWTGAEEIKPIFCTEAQWQSSVTQYGSCGKFVYDSVNNTVRLPKVTGFIEGASGVANLGDLTQAGLPNITGKIQGTVDNSAVVQWEIHQAASGALYGTDSYSGSTVSAGSRSWTAYNNLSIDASRSNSIYGNSNTVQPQSVKVLYYIVIATTTKTSIEVDIDEIATDLNGKADVDLTNVNNTGTSMGASWAAPSGVYENLTFGASGTTYTAPATGWFNFSGSTGADYGGIQLVAQSNGFTAASQSIVTSGTLNVSLYVKKGEVVNLVYWNGTPNVGTFRFIYAEGSKWEA